MALLPIGGAGAQMVVGPEVRRRDALDPDVCRHDDRGQRAHAAYELELSASDSEFSERIRAVVNVD